MVPRLENSAIKVKAFRWRGAFRIGSDHGVEGEQGRILTLVQDFIGITQIVGVSDGYGGNKLARKVRVVEKTVAKQLRVDLLEFFEGSA